MKFNSISSSATSTTIIEGWTKINGLFPADIIGHPYERLDENDTTRSEHIRVKVLQKNTELDKGIFLVKGVQVTLQTISLFSDKDELMLISNAKENSKGEWYYPAHKPVETTGQIFLEMEDGSWCDVTNLPEMEELWNKYREYQKKQTELWRKVFKNLQVLGIPASKARKMLRLHSWVDLEDFARFLGVLRQIQPTQKQLERALMVDAKSHIENILGVLPEHLTGAQMAIRWYAEENGFMIDE